MTKSPNYFLYSCIPVFARNGAFLRGFLRSCKVFFADSGWGWAVSGNMAGTIPHPRTQRLSMLSKFAVCGLVAASARTLSQIHQTGAIPKNAGEYSELGSLERSCGSTRFWKEM
jgi:hypothetical protein